MGAVVEDVTKMCITRAAGDSSALHSQTHGHTVLLDDCCWRHYRLERERERVAHLDTPRTISTSLQFAF